ncbi:Arogenate dehydratase/prephenate dehydratase 6, chloroplastic [Ananas comosus]|uniref:arogenate dehydratase n=1 Tax=Ananas comosus TaxID=4615 RepID=A0A199VJU4_ANACO|nr:Arogenate dehydratase/prephenate dehydratase 6, chloroplastic [Ananas comosus]
MRPAAFKLTWASAITSSESAPTDPAISSDAPPSGSSSGVSIADTPPPHASSTAPSNATPTPTPTPRPRPRDDPPPPTPLHRPLPTPPPPTTTRGQHQPLQLVPSSGARRISDDSGPVGAAAARVAAARAYQGVPGAYSEAAPRRPTRTARPSPATSSRRRSRRWSTGSRPRCCRGELAGGQHPPQLRPAAAAPAPHRGRGAVQRPPLPAGPPGGPPGGADPRDQPPQALAQCELTLTGMGLNVAASLRRHAGAAEHVAAQGLRDTAAIASARAAELYGLEVLADGIQTTQQRDPFLMLAREPIVPRTDRPFKTSIVLAAFAFRDIRLSKIESRPHKHRPVRLVDDAGAAHRKRFEYTFYIDFEASLAEPRAQRALAEIQEFTSFLRVLGSYPMDMTPWTPSASANTPPPPPPTTTTHNNNATRRYHY